MTNLKIKGVAARLHQKLLAELGKIGFEATGEPTDLAIRVKCPVNQSDVPGEIVHRILEEDENLLKMEECP